MEEFNFSDFLRAETVRPGESVSDLKRRARNAKKQKTYRSNHPDYEIKETQRRATERAYKRPPDVFIGVDCEGAPGRVPEGSRVPLVLIRAGEDYLAESFPGLGISWREALDWLCRRPRGYTYIAYAFNYDVWSILAGYPDKRAIERLVKRGMAYFITGDAGWQVWHISRKRFKVSPIRHCPKNPTRWCSAVKRCEFCGRDTDESRGHPFAVSDVFTYFQCSFVKAINDWKTGTLTEREMIEDGKDNLREQITYMSKAEREETNQYNGLECKHLAELMTYFANAWYATGLPRPRNWEGPASLAKRTFEAYRVPKREELEKLDHIPGEVWNAAKLAMIGGWFETRLYGPIGQCITEFDKTSAYPDAMLHLPCLRHHRWEQRTPKDGEYALQLARAVYNRPVKLLSEMADGYKQLTFQTVPDWESDPKHPLFMGLPHRDSTGRVSRPLDTTGWYWNFEIAEARHQDIEILDSWVMVSEKCDCKYDRFSFIPELFHRRQMLGKLKGKPLKLGLNSMYGITAQRKRGDSEPPYTNYIAASFITAWTRTSIMRLIHEYGCEKGLQCGANVVMIATDAVFFLGSPDIPAIPVEEKEKAQLGEWTRETFPNGLFIVQGGIYWPPESTQAESRTRGVPASMLHPHLKEFETSYRRMVETRDVSEGVVTVSKRLRPDGKIVNAIRFVGAPDAINRNAWKELGTFQPFSRDIGFDWSSKRALIPASYSPDMSLRTLPKAVDNPVSCSRDETLDTFMGIQVAKFTSEANRQALLDDTPDWLPVLQGTPEDEGFVFGERL
jgi:hypothetical protein